MTIYGIYYFYMYTYIYNIYIYIDTYTYLPVHLHIPGVSKCCSNPKHTSTCDPHGNQIFVCGKGGYQVSTHSTVSLETQSMLSTAGVSTKREDFGTLREF